MPLNQMLDRGPTISVHWNGSRYLTTFDDILLIEQVSYRSIVLPNVSDPKAQQLTDASASGDTEHE
jgi:hypothetical protein